MKLSKEKRSAKMVLYHCHMGRWKWFYAILPCNPTILRDPFSFFELLGIASNYDIHMPQGQREHKPTNSKNGGSRLGAGYFTRRGSKPAFGGYTSPAPFLNIYTKKEKKKKGVVLKVHHHK